MARCEDCIHQECCVRFAGARTLLCGEKADERCKMFKSTADVVPRAMIAEIFEEIESEITEALKCNYKRRTEYYTKERFKKEDGEFINTVNGKIDALRGIEGFIAELKKKYTEGE